MMGETRFIPTLGFVLAGMILWAAAFAAAYGVASIVCARRLDDVDVLGLAILPFSIGVITLATLAGTGLIGLAAYRRRRKAGDDVPTFVPSMALIVALLAVVGIVWNGLPALFFATCA